MKEAIDLLRALDTLRFAAERPHRMHTIQSGEARTILDFIEELRTAHGQAAEALRVLENRVEVPE